MRQLFSPFHQCAKPFNMEDSQPAFCCTDRILIARPCLAVSRIDTCAINPGNEQYRGGLLESPRESQNACREILQKLIAKVPKDCPAKALIPKSVLQSPGKRRQAQRSRRLRKEKRVIAKASRKGPQKQAHGTAFCIRAVVLRDLVSKCSGLFLVAPQIALAIGVFIPLLAELLLVKRGRLSCEFGPGSCCRCWSGCFFGVRSRCCSGCFTLLPPGDSGRSPTRADRAAPGSCLIHSGSRVLPAAHYHAHVA